VSPGASARAAGERFGSGLRRERERRTVSLGEIAAATKIPQRVLERLEAGEMAELPPQVFVRGFVRAYARHLGLSETEQLAALDAALRAAEPQPEPPPPPVPTGERALSLHPRARSGFALLVLVIVLLVVAARWLGP
jgi:cytoskeletal protein RodZ